MRKPKFPLTGIALAAAGLLLAPPPASAAEPPSINDLLQAVVKVHTWVPGDARTAATLGRERHGSGIVIDGTGLVLTIGYLMVEASGAEVTTHDGRTVAAQTAGYDHETGFGLLRSIEPLRVKPLQIGKSADLKERDLVLVASHGGKDMAAPAYVVARREFTGSWEYLLDNAIFTSPPHPTWSGAALIGGDGKLVGVGSLIVGDATGAGTHFPGNMFVPIDLLRPILGDLIADGQVSGPGRPWLGINAEEFRGRLFVARVTPDGPAHSSGIKAGDVILGVNGQPVTGLADFYRKVWAHGAAGATVTLNVLQGAESKAVDVRSANRLGHLRLKSTY
ncbi:MAG: S1C family serine protease [Pseudomonadota bacterium]